MEKGLPPVARTGLQFPGGQKEGFDRRQPEHILLAGTLGLGVADVRRVDHRRIDL